MDSKPERQPGSGPLPDGASAKGGKARAEKLSKKERSDIAKKAAIKRWGPKLPKAIYDGEITLGDGVLVIPCAVLEDGTRVLTQSGVMKALGRARQAKGRQYYSGDANLPAFLTAKNLKPFVDTDLEVASSQIEFTAANGQRAFGYRAELLPKICEVFLAARDANALARNQEHIAKQADILMRGLARVGIVALVDEATGYQYDRSRNALEQILEAFIKDELGKWAKRFPDEFYEHLFRLKGREWPSSRKMPQHVGHWTNNLVYKRMAPGVLDELKQKTPRTVRGNRKNKYHQWLTDDVGHPKLQEHLASVITLMKSCDDWEDFEKRLNKSLPKYKPMPLFDDKDGITKSSSIE